MDDGRLHDPRVEFSIAFCIAGRFELTHVHWSEDTISRQLLLIGNHFDGHLEETILLGSNDLSRRARRINDKLLNHNLSVDTRFSFSTETNTTSNGHLGTLIGRKTEIDARMLGTDYRILVDYHSVNWSDDELRRLQPSLESRHVVVLDDRADDAPTDGTILCGTDCANLGQRFQTGMRRRMEVREAQRVLRIVNQSQTIVRVVEKTAKLCRIDSHEDVSTRTRTMSTEHLNRQHLGHQKTVMVNRPLRTKMKVLSDGRVEEDSGLARSTRHRTEQRNDEVVLWQVFAQQETFADEQPQLLLNLLGPLVLHNVDAGARFELNVVVALARRRLGG